MFNPLAQLKLISDELNNEGIAENGSNKLGIIEALLIKFLFAFVIVFCLYVYLDKTSSLNGRSPEENKILFKEGYKEELEAKKKAEDVDENGGKDENRSGKSTSLGTVPGTVSSRSRKT